MICSKILASRRTGVRAFSICAVAAFLLFTICVLSRERSTLSAVRLDNDGTREGGRFSFMRRFESKPGVYLIRNLVNSKVYVGSSADLSRRWIVHKNDLKNGRQHNRHLQSAFNKYGPDAFDFVVLEVIDLQAGAALRGAEQVWIDRLKACDRSHGYNIIPNSQHKFLSDETKALLSAVRTGKRLSDSHCDAIRQALKRRYAAAPKPKRAREKKAPVSLAEVSRKISAALQGHPVSAETRARISAAKAGKPQLTRRALTREQREAIRAKHASGKNFCELGREYGVSRVTIRNVIRNIYGD